MIDTRSASFLAGRLILCRYSNDNRMMPGIESADRQSVSMTTWAYITTAIRLRYDYDTTTMKSWHVNFLLALNRFEWKQARAIRRSLVVVVSQSNLNCNHDFSDSSQRRRHSHAAGAVTPHDRLLFGVVVGRITGSSYYSVALCCVSGVGRTRHRCSAAT